MRSEIKLLPSDFLERLKHILPSQKWDELVNTFADKKPTTFRINTLKTNSNAVEEKLSGKGFQMHRVSWYPDAFLIRKGTLRDLQETDVYKQGEIYVQSLPSMIPPLVLQPEAGDNVLDLTAAPGSKTTQMACLMKNKGRILANDSNKPRFFRLKSNVESQGAKNIELSLHYGETFGKKFPETFDKILLDAPCSAEGRFNTSEPSSFGYWKTSKVYEMAKKQKKLLFSALHALKPGGTLVYSTCTYAPEENEGVLNWALQKFGAAVRIEPISFHLPNQMSGIASWEKESFDPAVRKAIRILPNQQMEGFFVAKLLKPASFSSLELPALEQ